ncbi:hypothetical protein AB0H36_32295 [Kribbella sp. NPDC050820]|uniref:hypothetical protein n=1 Tax=Kribbella sp. NPDC050820 TaxID=3155408 RepID=UPI0033E17056
MPRRKHKFSLRVSGLTDEQAAHLHYLLANLANSFTRDPDKYETISNVPLKVLRAEFPDYGWRGATAAERVDLVK